MATLSEQEGVNKDIHGSLLREPPRGKSLSQVAWGRFKSFAREKAGQVILNTRTRNRTPPPRSRDSVVSLATPTAIADNVTRDLIPPIEFDVNATVRDDNAGFKAKVTNVSWALEKCTRQNNVVFIKTHKTGSTSLSHIVNRYGHLRNLSFVFNRLSPRNGHLVYLPLNNNSPRTHFLPPIGVKPGEYSRYKYNMLAVHVRYDRKAMDSFMLPNTHYITVIRDPATQFESAFTHFQLDDAFMATEKAKFSTMQARLTQFFTKPDFYRKRLKQLKWENKIGLRWYYARNNQIFDLGLDHIYHNDNWKVQEYIKKLDREFLLVLITEYFEESLVVMRKALCWSMDDIIYVAKNVRPNPANISSATRQKMRQWNDVDTKLYEHFNRSLWQKIKDYGPSFSSDLDSFRTRLRETFQDCVGTTEVKAQGHYFHWIEYKPRKDSSNFCAQIVESKRALFAAIWRKQALPKPAAAARKSGYHQVIRPEAHFHKYTPIANRYKPDRPHPVPRAPLRLPPGNLARLPPPPRQVVKHVIGPQGAGRSKSDPGEDNGDYSSSAEVIRGETKQVKTAINHTAIAATGTRVKPVMTYKKNT
ncbi:galactose-3-O-sulfotransferase 2-like [Diadema setosum]|uniref:galactose-3-O-sulfotransferase 2-like n=1 Tax=Diadema setosum TaxID=31175 RepID=UPI003B3B365E